MASLESQGTLATLAGAVLTGEILTGETVRVTARMHPFDGERVILDLPAGLSVEELAASAYAGRTRALRWQGDLVATLEGTAVPRALWPRVRPKAGTSLVLKPVPRGGVARIILTIVVAIAAVVAAIYAPYLLPGLTQLEASLVGAAAAAAVSIVGNILINALFPIRPPELENSGGRKELFSIAAVRNEADPFGPIPVILGRHRVYPKFGARPYTEVLGDDEYLRGLFVWGYGPLDITDLKLGESPLSSFDDVEIQTFYGYPDDAAPTLYPGQVIQESLSVELTPQDRFIRTTAADVDEISFDVIAPQGVFRVFVKNGTYENATVVVQAEYRAVGATTWLSFGTLTITNKKQDVLRRGLRRSVPRGQYELSLRRTTPKSTDPGYLTTDTLTWTALRGFRNDPPIRFTESGMGRPLAVTAIRIRATAQLNGTLDTLNGVCTSRVKAWNGSAWVEDQPSRNPASLYRHVCQGPANARALDDAHVDLAGLAGWGDYCIAEGFTFDMVVEGRTTVYEMLATIASAARASLTTVDGKQGVIWDQPDAPIVQHFTPRNSRNFRGNRVYKHWPHALRVRFQNEEQGWSQDERIVYADDYDADNATLFEALEFPGVTSSGLIWRQARFMMAQAKLRPERFTLEVDFESLVCSRGDRVRVSHDVPLLGVVSGRVKAVQSDLPQSVDLDQVVTQAVGGSYAVRFRLADGSSLLRNVITEAGESRTLRLVGNGAMPDVGDLAMFGEAGQETAVFRVYSVEPMDQLAARLTLVDDAPDISQADLGEIPPYESQITIPPDPFTLPPRNLLVRESVLVGEDGVPLAAAALSWQVPRFGQIRAFAVQASDVSSMGPWDRAVTVPAPSTATTLSGLQPGVWWFRVRCLFQDGTASAWLASGAVPLLALQAAPPTPANFRIAVLGDQATLTWDRVAGVTFSHYVLRFSPQTGSASWGSAPLLQDRVTGTSLQVPARPGTYLLKAVTLSGRESDFAAEIVTTLSLATTLNAVETLDEDPGFDGAKEDVVFDASLGGLRLADLAGGTGSGSGSGSGATGTGTASGSDGGAALSAEGYYTFAEGLDLGQVYTSRLAARIEAQGIRLNDDIFDLADWFERPDFFGGIASGWQVVLEQRVSNNALSDPGAVWSDWSEFTASDVTARSFQWRLWLGRDEAGITPLVTGLGVTVDMPDRTIAGNDLTVPVEGLRVEFDPPYRALKGVGFALQDLESGDRYRVTYKDEAGFDIAFFDDVGTPVERTFDYVAVGYGRRLPPPPVNLTPPAVTGEALVGVTLAVVPGVWSGES